MKLSIIIPMYNSGNKIIRCLKSIEQRDDVEVIIIDDCSQDESLQIATDWCDGSNLKSTIIHNKENLGVGLTINKGYDQAAGEYVMTLCDDDYLQKPISEMFKYLDGADIVYYDMELNNGNKIILDEKTSRFQVGATKFYRREIIGDTRRSRKRYGGDWDFYYEILNKNPTEKYTKELLYHYDYPRQNSLLDKMVKKETQDEYKEFK